MSELELQLRVALERLAPSFDDEAADWADVRRRAEASPAARRPGARRRLVLAFALIAVLVLGASPFGRAFVKGAIDGFSSWVSGSPGEPAPAEEQAKFEHVNQRAPFGFPEGTELRLLIRHQVRETTYELYGFRSDDFLCLRLLQTGTAGPRPTACVALRILESGPPVSVAMSDYPFGTQDVPPNEDGYVPAGAMATFGFVADGVARVDVDGDAGRAQAVVASNTFLYVADKPSLTSRIRRVIAIDEQGKRTSIPIAVAPFAEGEPPFSPPVELGGPTQVEWALHGGAIGWLERREPRGEPLPDSELFRRYFSGLGEVLYARVIHPNPESTLRVIVAAVNFDGRGGPLQRDRGENVCIAETRPLGGGMSGGCSPPGALFDRAPINSSLGLMAGGDQFATLSGVGSDDVARVELYLASGKVEHLLLVDNTYATEIRRTSFPVKLVAYDAEGRVVGIERFEGFDRSSNPERPIVTERRTILEVTGPGGSKATLSFAPSNLGGHCYWFSVTGGAGGSVCIPKGGPPAPLNLGLTGSGSGDGDVFLDGPVSEDVAEVELRFEDGAMLSVDPVEGYVVFGIPLEHHALAHRLELAVGRDGSGAEVGRQRFETRTPGLYPCEEPVAIGDDLKACP